MNFQVFFLIYLSARRMSFLSAIRQPDYFFHRFPESGKWALHVILDFVFLAKRCPGINVENISLLVLFGQILWKKILEKLFSFDNTYGARHAACIATLYPQSIFRFHLLRWSERWISAAIFCTRRHLARSSTENLRRRNTSRTAAFSALQRQEPKYILFAKKVINFVLSRWIFLFNPDLLTFAFSVDLFDSSSSSEIEFDKISAEASPQARSSGRALSLPSGASGESAIGKCIVDERPRGSFPFSLKGEFSSDIDNPKSGRN